MGLLVQPSSYVLCVGGDPPWLLCKGSSVVWFRSVVAVVALAVRNAHSFVYIKTVGYEQDDPLLETNFLGGVRDKIHALLSEPENVCVCATSRPLLRAK